MVRFYADEQFPLPVVKQLQTLGHDVLTVQAAGNAEQGIPDDKVLAFAVVQRRCILTLDRYDFIKLHRGNPGHVGIVVCTNDRNWTELAARIDRAISIEQNFQGKLIRVTRPAK